jgi:hypothetical protein
VLCLYYNYIFIPNVLNNSTNLKYLREVAYFYKDILPNYEIFNAEVELRQAKWRNIQYVN